MRPLLCRRRARPTLDLSFLGVLPSLASFSRASSGWHFDATGTLTQAATNAPRFDHDPVTLAPNGLWIEEQRTNMVRNAAASGATVGTLDAGGALPSNWSAAAVTGVTMSVQATGTENGMATVDVRFTASSAGATGLNLRFETNTAIGAVSGQNWTSGFYVKLVAGSLSGLSAAQAVTAGLSSGGSDTESTTTGFTPGAAWQRVYAFRALNSGTTAYLSPRFALTFANGAAFDITLRFALPQAEQGSFPTSPIVTTGTTATRAADNVYLGALGTWFNPNEGALACDYRNNGILSGSYFARVVAFTDGTSSNEISLFINGAAQRLCGLLKTGGVTQADTTSTTPFTTPTEGALLRQALRYRTNDIAVSNNGAAVQTDSSATLPAVNQLQLFRRDSTSTSINSGWLRRFRYWNYGPDNATLQQVTA